MGETIPCPAGCGGTVYDAGSLDASDLIELCGCRDANLDYPEDQGVHMPVGPGGRSKLELGIDRALDGVYLAREGLGELADKPAGVEPRLEAALRELRDALGLVPPGAAGLVQPTSEENRRG
jgi:hypothetical protein